MAMIEVFWILIDAASHRFRLIRIGHKVSAAIGKNKEPTEGRLVAIL